MAGRFFALALASVALASSSPSNASNSLWQGGFHLTSEVACACQQLSKIHSAEVLSPSSANYSEERIRFWDIRSDLHPACIFQPSNADEVAEGVKILSECNAPFAIRGGGHMNFPGSNNIDGGVLVTLNKLRDYKVHKDTIEVGPGMKWIDVIRALEPHHRAAIGGRLKTIGVPGLTLIGGVHYFINKYGFAMDNVERYDVVLGNGTQVIADSSTNCDLFWALKGGANNFGLVTKFTLKTHHMPKVSTTIQTFNESGVYDFIDAAVAMSRLDEPHTIAAGGILTLQYNATTKVVSASIMGVQEGVSKPPSQFANFTAIDGPIKMHNVTTMRQWTEDKETPNQMFRIAFAKHSIIPDTDRLYEIYQAWKKGIDTLSDVQGIHPTFVINLCPIGAVRAGRNTSVGNTWDLPLEPTVWWQFSTGWDLAQDDIRVTTWSRQLSESLHEENRQLSLAREHVYMGDAGEWQDAFATFPKKNIQRLKEIRAAVDPKGVFSRLNYGGFKLAP
ncbi:putative FAD-binding oxidoreductase [Aspergillus steynii IBT 23096]|uniref:Putative FAD-binding oxidoreductase n=1 Tax=Aspergillus steynii IBT 23096 TaxID=1392250 RepID=A0A2I2GSD9_9EURO|nr:putative FAD-binding oxidoreductase [Aspergillus steynii IBT 23096]PLB55787.1 putative FAD-binding oxidoreductase [Aspergillus steynii IBT 23096]